MSRRAGLSVLALLAAFSSTARAEEVVVDFEQADIGKPVPTWTDKGVTFQLAGPLSQSTAAGRIMFFPHLATNRKGILNAMATEQAIPVLARLPVNASSVTLVLWGSTGCPAMLEALDKDGKVVDVASRAAMPMRKAPADPAPFIELTVKAPAISAIRFNGPRDGEFLAADELRFTAVEAR